MAISDRFPQGIFTISLDFELFWGMADLLPLDDDYKAVLERTRDTVVPRLLDLFESSGIHATWATVGFLFHDSGDSLRAAIPDRLPEYANPARSPYPLLGDVGDDESTDPHRLAPGLIRRIAATPGQEVGCHSHSHFYCLEPGATDAAFAADLAAWTDAAAGHAVVPGALCFGRNQFHAGSITTAAEAGFVAYRGVEASPLYQPAALDDQPFVRKLVRYADTYLPLTRHNCIGPAEIASTTPSNVASSRFLRAHRRRLRFLEPLKLRRIISGMSHAAERGLLYHLWWHPQDFAVDLDENLALIEAVAHHFANLRDEGSMKAMTMSEVATAADESAPPPNKP